MEARERNRSRLSLRAAVTHFWLRDDHAQMQDAAIRIRIVADASTFRENLVELDLHIPSKRMADQTMKQHVVVLRYDR
jgi:hypothetical protein